MDTLVTVRLPIIFLPSLPPLLFSLPCYSPFLVTSLPISFSFSLYPLSSPPQLPLLSLSLPLLPSHLSFSSLSLTLLFGKHYSFLSSDIDECALGTNNCNQICHNTIGSYYCSCNPGYHLLNHPHICSGILMR